MAAVLDHAITPLLDAYEAVLSSKAAGTTDTYLRALRQFIRWLADRPGSGGNDRRSDVRVEQVTKTAVETYLAHLDAAGYSLSTRARAKSALSGFAQWLIEEQQLLRRNPTRGADLPAQPLLAPRQLSPDQRYVLRELVERDGTTRSAALFALGYWAGCRVSDVSWLRREEVHIEPMWGGYTSASRAARRATSIWSTRCGGRCSSNWRSRRSKPNGVHPLGARRWMAARRSSSMSSPRSAQHASRSGAFITGCGGCESERRRRSGSWWAISPIMTCATISRTEPVRPGGRWKR